MLGACSSGGLLTSAPLELYRNDFSTDAMGQVPYLFTLATRTGGKSAVFEALGLAIDKIESSPGVKNIIALVHGPDQVSTVTANALITKAQLKQVRISVVMLGTQESASDWTKISASTGGYYSLCPTKDEMITTLNNIYRLVNGACGVYHLRVKYTPAAGSLSPGMETIHQLKVYDNLYSYAYNPIMVYVKIQ